MPPPLLLPFQKQNPNFKLKPQSLSISLCQKLRNEKKTP